MNRLATLISLGCAKNLVDSEMMAPQLLDLGYTMTSDPSEASLILVNTCGFLESAVQEAIQTILHLAAHKSGGCCESLVVTGCMVQRYGRKLPKLLPEVDLFLGTSHYHELGDALRSMEKGIGEQIRIGAPRHLFSGQAARLRSTPPGFAYIKIAEGCSNRCAFCLIPHLRGPYRSRKVEDVCDEASRLAREGVREINLIAQDTTAFGSDRGEQDGLIRLLDALERVTSPGWIRLLYAYPDRVNEALLKTMAQSKKILPYLDIPLQHCVAGILEAMRREKNFSHAESLIALVRKHLPGAVLRTSLIVGFPGETDADFQSLLRFVEDVQFDHLGVFAFSSEPGTVAARLPFQLPEEVKEERRSLVLDLQQTISRRRLKRYVGRIMPVLIEGFHPETELLLTGRLSSQAPEVDGEVIITEGVGNPGTIMLAKITASHDYDLEAELLPFAGHDTCPGQVLEDGPSDGVRKTL